MKTIQKHWPKLCSAAAGITAGVLILFSPAWESVADDVPTPGLLITVTNTTNYIKITNGVSFANYELYRRTALDPTYPWALATNGALGQTNFVAEMGPFNMGFFLITVGTNWDGDAFENAVDADPSNPSVGILSITIDSPTNGTTFN